MKRLYFKHPILFLVFLLTAFQFGTAQSRSNQPIQVLVSPNKADWTYAADEEVKFSVSVFKHQVAINDVEVTYTIGWEKMEPIESGSKRLRKAQEIVGSPIITDTPGFIRCEVKVTVDGEEFRGIATAAVT